MLKYTLAVNVSGLEGSFDDHYRESYTVSPSVYRCPCGTPWPEGALIHKGYLPPDATPPHGGGVGIYVEKITGGPWRVKRWLACGSCIGSATVAPEARDLFLTQYPGEVA